MLANDVKRKMNHRNQQRKESSYDSDDSPLFFPIQKPRMRRNVSFESVESDGSAIPAITDPPPAPSPALSIASSSPKILSEGRKMGHSLAAITDKTTKITAQQISKVQDKATESLSKATELTTRKLSKATEHTTRQIGTALMHSEKAYKRSRWCAWARFLSKFPKYFPRVFSLTFGVLVPLWVLILISAGFGVLLADFEATEERISNHEILRSRARINRTFIKRSDISQLPVDCYSRFLNNSTNRTLFMERIDAYILAASSLEILKDMNARKSADANTELPADCSLPNVNMTLCNSTYTNATDTNITTVNETETIPPTATPTSNVFKHTFGNSTNAISGLLNSISPSDLDGALSNIVTDAENAVMDYMNQCQEEQNADIRIYLDVRDQHREASDLSMKFNWNRCWPKEINEIWGDSKFVFLPSPDLVKASHPSQQAATVETEFVRALEQAEKECLDLGGHEEECFEQALEDASEAAGNICHHNVEATSWFFFTIMTTVGYGNQTPVTHEGRLFIYIAGITCLILFAGVLGSAGYIIMEIFDDFVSRFAISYFLQYPLVGVLMWGGIWIGWAYAIATDAEYWWEQRLPDVTVDVPDSLWFAFISTSTIGLGDYFLQPEVMFAGDALKFSVEYLIGFVFLSTFLNKIGEFIFTILPKREGNLETRLRNTNLFFWKHWPCTDFESLRPYIYNGKDPEVEKPSMREQVLQYQQAKRVEVVKSLLPRQSNMSTRRSSIQTLVEEKTMEDLLDEEETLLKRLLESVEQRRRAHLPNTEESNPVEPEPQSKTNSTTAGEDRQHAAIEESLGILAEKPKYLKDDSEDFLYLAPSKSSSTMSSLVEL